MGFVLNIKIKNINLMLILVINILSNTRNYTLALLHITFDYLKYIINSPPKPHAFVSLPLQSFSLLSLLKAPTPCLGPIAQRCVDLRRTCVEYEHILELTKRAPRIIYQIDTGQKLSSEDKTQAKRVGIGFDNDDRPDAYAKGDLEGFIENKTQNKEDLRKAKSELDRLIKGDFQDSSDVTNDAEPFDPFDPDG